MSLLLTGRLVGIVSTTFTDRATGEVTKNHTAEIFHKQGGRSTVDTVKLQPETILEWSKCEGKDVSFEVRPYALKTKEGGIMQGFSLADKLALPNIITAHAK